MPGYDCFVRVRVSLGNVLQMCLEQAQ